MYSYIYIHIYVSISIYLYVYASLYVGTMWDPHTCHVRYAVAYSKFYLPKYPHRGSYSERIDDDFVLLICFCIF